MFHIESHPTTTNTQSIRSSCDRCRLQKLKCTVQGADSDGRMVCERCVRAKVACVFGRRRRASRPSETKKRAETSASRQSTTPPNHQETIVLTPPLSTSASSGDIPLGVTTPPTLGASAPQTPLETLMECEPDIESLPTYQAHQPWDSLTPTLLHSATSGIDGQTGGGMTGWSWLDHEFSPDDLYCLDPELLGGTPPSASSSGSPTPSNIHQPLEGITTRDNSRITASVAGRRLPALIVEMQQRLETLENESWLHDNARSFDRYPIGAVLRLSQEFGALAGQVLGIAVSYTSDETTATLQTMPPTKFEPNQPPNGSTTTNNNTATLLLILSGYLFLIRLYGLVLGHFHAHLARIPSGSLAGAHINLAGRAAATSAALQLGELPSGGAMPDVSRIHAALGMLLAALHGVEEQLGQGGEVAREMVVALLTTTQGGNGVSAGLEPCVSQLQDGLGGLGEKVRSVKELLREKMGL